MSDSTYSEGVAAGVITGAKDITDAKAEIRKQRTRQYAWVQAADGAAGTTVAETLACNALFSDGLVYDGYVTFDTAVVAADATKATINVYKYDAAGLNKTLIATANTATVGGGGTGNITARVRTKLTLQNAAVSVPKGGSFTFEELKAGAGTQLGKYFLELHVLDQ